MGPFRERVGYVVKRYPRFSETFIVNEILAHEAAGMQLEIFSLRPSVDTHFQNVISQVRAAVNYLPGGSVKSETFWRLCHKLARKFPRLWRTLAEAKHADVVEAYQAIELAALTRGISWRITERRKYMHRVLTEACDRLDQILNIELSTT